MSDHSQLIARVAHRNPVPNIDDPPTGAWNLDVVRSAVTERDTAKLTKEGPSQTTPTKQVRHRKGWQVAFASFAIILIAAGGLWLVARSETPGDVAAQPLTTNSPANEPERVALDTLVAYFTGEEAAFRELSSASGADLERQIRDFRLDRALNSWIDAINCSLSESDDSNVNCQFIFRNDLYEVFAVDGSPSEASIVVIDSGWASIGQNPTRPPLMNDYLDDVFSNGDLFSEDGLCRPGLDIDFDACAAAFVEGARIFVAENG